MSYGATVNQAVVDRDDAFRSRRRDERSRLREARQQHDAAARWVQTYMPDCCHAVSGEPHALVVGAAYFLRIQLRARAVEFGFEDRRPTPDEVRWRLAQTRPWVLDEIETWRAS